MLELLYCEACGETFFGGYRRQTTIPNEWFLSPDHPNLEAAPELITQDREYTSYAVYWPAGQGLLPRTPSWQQDGVQRQWARAELHPQEARVELGQGQGFLYHVPAMHGTVAPAIPSASRAFPALCPRCDADWSDFPPYSPVRSQRTGFQKVGQVLADTLLRHLGSGTWGPAAARKLVLFSDSRQDAAKLSAGMNMAHYLDALRQTECDALAQQGAGALALHRQLTGQQLTPTEQVAAARYPTEHPQEAATVSLANSPATATISAPSHPGMTCQAAAAQIPIR